MIDTEVDDCDDEKMESRLAIRLIFIPESSVSYKNHKSCQIPKEVQTPYDCFMQAALTMSSFSWAMLFSTARNMEA
jgi:hypothetical protein